jgi:trehalose synthase
LVREGVVAATILIERTAHRVSELTGGDMIERVDIREHVRLDDYARFLHLAEPVRELRSEAALCVPRLAGRTVWMLSSTRSGGGVAEMMPRLVSILRELGVATEWVVMRPERPEFFALTKRLHGLLHGEGDPRLGPSDRALYERVSEECARALHPLLAPGDLLVVHDPQPLGAGARLKASLGLPAIWRCHIGLEVDSPVARAGWSFLQPYAEAFDHASFSAPEYIRDFLAGRASVMRPTIDPLGHKSRELTPHKLVGILCNSGLVAHGHPVLTPPFADPALRLRPDGTFAPADRPADVGLLFRPVVTQVSRWDRLKGFRQLLDGFLALKRRVDDGAQPPRHRRRLEIVRLVLAGPDPTGIQDDPEARDVLAELVAAYVDLEPRAQADVAILTLPMSSLKENALMVNALQRCSTVVVQSSLREGFGLTATEAMWKGVPVLGTHAWGLRQQIRDGLDGRLVAHPEDPGELAQVLDEMLADPKQRSVWGQNGQRRVHEEFLVFRQVREWLRLLGACDGRAGAASPRSP